MDVYTRDLTTSSLLQTFLSHLYKQYLFLAFLETTKGISPTPTTQKLRLFYTIYTIDSHKKSNSYN